MGSVVGFDISTVSTGWCFYDGSVRFCMGTILGDKKSALSDRLLGLYRQSGELLDRLKPDSVLLEGVFAYRNIKVAKTLSEAAAMVKLQCYKRDLPITIIGNTSVKSWAGVRTKEALYKYVLDSTGLDLLDLPPYAKFNDVVDAFALVLCYLDTNNALGSKFDFNF